jgi:hypothetical protein
MCTVKGLEFEDVPKTDTFSYVIDLLPTSGVQILT